MDKLEFTNQFAGLSIKQISGPKAFLPPSPRIEKGEYINILKMI